MPKTPFVARKFDLTPAVSRTIDNMSSRLDVSPETVVEAAIMHLVWLNRSLVDHNVRWADALRNGLYPPEGEKNNDDTRKR